MIRVDVRDFQSIEKLSIEVEGFTALVGRSNIGKSALVRAIKAALTNELGTNFVRHGTDCARVRRGLKTCKCKTSVHLQMEDFDLLWEKGDADNKYTFNGQVYDSPGQGIPDFLIENGFAPVKIGEKSGMIQISDQFFPIFLLNQSGPAVADAISDVARLDRINKAMRLVDKDKRENISTRKVREKDVAALKEKLSGYDALDASLLKMELAAVRLDNLTRAHGRVTKLGEYVERSQEIVSRIKVIWEVGKVPIPVTKPVLGLWEMVRTLHSHHARLSRVAEEFKAASWVEKLSIPDVGPIVDQLKNVKKYDSWAVRLQTLIPAIAKTNTAEKTKIPSIASIVETHAKVATLTAYEVKLAQLGKVVKGLETEFNRVAAEEAKAIAEFKTLGVCPTCTLPITDRHLHA